MHNEIVELGAALTALAVKGTVTAVNTKIKTIKNEKNAETIRSNYDEIVNELISEREEAIRIAHIYKRELERIVISDEDIQHLNKTVTKVLGILKEMNPNMPLDAFESLNQLINVDTLKAIQLLGFNYKEAIGEPLTILCASAILSKAPNSRNQIRKK